MASDRKFKIGHVLEERIKPDGTLEFLIKWKKYPHSSNSWEPLEHMERLLQNWHIQELRRITSGKIKAPIWYSNHLKRENGEDVSTEDEEKEEEEDEEEEEEDEWNPGNATSVGRKKKNQLAVTRSTPRSTQRQAGGSRSISRKRTQAVPPAHPPATNVRQTRRARRGGVVTDPHESDHDGVAAAPQERRSRRDSAPQPSRRSDSSQSVLINVAVTSSAAKKNTHSGSSATGSNGQGSSGVQPKDLRDPSKAEDGSPSRNRVRRSQAELVLEAARTAGEGATSSPSPVRQPRSRSKVVPRSSGQGTSRRQDAAPTPAAPPASIGVDEPVSPGVSASMTIGGALSSRTPGGSMRSGVVDAAMDLIHATFSGVNDDDNSSIPSGSLATSSQMPAVPVQGSGPAPVESGEAIEEAINVPPAAPPAEEEMTVPSATTPAPNKHSMPTSTGDSATVIVPSITAPVGVHDMGSGDSQPLENPDAIPPTSPVSKPATMGEVQTTPSPTTSSSSQPSGGGDQGDDEGDGGKIPFEPVDGGTASQDAVTVKSHEQQPIVHSTPSASGEKNLPSTSAEVPNLNTAHSVPLIPVDHPSTSGLRDELRREVNQVTTGRAAKVESRQDWAQLKEEGREHGDADSDCSWDTQIRTRRDGTHDNTIPYILPKRKLSCYRRFEWEAHLARTGGRAAPAKCFWTRNVEYSGNPFAGHEGQLLMAPPFGEAIYVQKRVPCKILSADPGPLIQVIPIYGKANPFWYFYSDPVLHRLSKEKRRKARARGYECVPKSCFASSLTWPMLPATNYFQIGDKLETYDRHGGKNGCCWFWPATVVDVDGDELTIHIDQMTDEAPTMKDRSVRYDNLRLFPCGFASAVAWKCAFPTETENMHGRPLKTRKGLKREIIMADDDVPSTSHHVFNIKNEPGPKMEMDLLIGSQAKKTRTESHTLNTAVGSMTNIGQFRAPNIPSTLPSRRTDLLPSTPAIGINPPNTRPVAIADKEIKEEPVDAEADVDTEPLTAPPASFNLHSPIADGPSSSGLIEPPRVDPTMANSGMANASRHQQRGDDVDMASPEEPGPGSIPSAARGKPRRGYAFSSRGSRGGARGGLARADQLPSMGEEKMPSMQNSMPQPPISISATHAGQLPQAPVAPNAVNVLRSIGDPSQVPFDWDAHLANGGGEAAPHEFLWKRPTMPFENPFEDREGQVLLAPDYVKPGEPLNYELSTICEVTNAMGPWVQVKPLFVPPDQKRWFMADDAVLKKFSDIDNLDKVRIPAMGAPHNFMNRVKKYIAKDEGRIAPDDCFGKISIAEKPSDENFEQLVGFKVEAYSPFNGNGVFWPATVVAVNGGNKLATVLFDGTNGTHEEKIPDICLFPCGYAASIGWKCELTRNLEKAPKKKAEDKRVHLLKKTNFDTPSTSQVPNTSRLAQVLRKINKPKTGRKRGRPLKTAAAPKDEAAPTIPRKRGRPSKADMIKREQELNGGQNQGIPVLEPQVFTAEMQIPAILRKPSLKASVDRPSTSKNHADNVEGHHHSITSQSGELLPRSEAKHQNGIMQPTPFQRQISSTSSPSHPTRFARVVLAPPPLPAIPSVTLLPSLPSHSYAPRMPIVNKRSIAQASSTISPPAREQTLQYVAMSKQLKRGNQSAYAGTKVSTSFRTPGGLEVQSGSATTMQGVSTISSATNGAVQSRGPGARPSSSSSMRMVTDLMPSTSSVPSAAEHPVTQKDYAEFLLKLQSSAPGASKNVGRIVDAAQSGVMNQMPASPSRRHPSVSQPPSSSVLLNQTPSTSTRPLPSATVVQFVSSAIGTAAAGASSLGAQARPAEPSAPPPQAVRRPVAPDETADDKALRRLVREVEQERPDDLLNHLKLKQVTFNQLMMMTESELADVTTNHVIAKKMYDRIRQIRC